MIAIIEPGDHIVLTLDSADLTPEEAQRMKDQLAASLGDRIGVTILGGVRDVIVQPHGQGEGEGE